MATKLQLLCFFVLLQATTYVWGTSFELVNSCNASIWPAIQPNAGMPVLENGGFALAAGETREVEAPAGWSGRIWGRSGCKFDGSGTGKCETGDCGGVLECRGAGEIPPATLFEVTLNGFGGKDFYDVSLVDGYNLQVVASPVGCDSIGCSSDLNALCPSELQLRGSDGRVVGCKSACEAFGDPQFCCTVAFASPQTCHPSQYSTLFKHSCPTSYSYAFDDASSTFTCTSTPTYTITFC